MALELVTPLPPGSPSHTRLAKHGARLVVLREIKDGTDCSWPPASPHLVTLQEVGELQGKRHALFEWVPGVTLRETIAALEQAGNPIPLGLVGRVLIDAARALAQVTPPRAHGGLQDASLQIGFDGQISVLDYGAPRLTRFRPLGRVNFSADVFALGGVLHSALTGFRGEYAKAPPSLPPPSSSHPEATPAIDDVVQRALSPQPDERQAGAGAFADELEAVLGELAFTHDQVSQVVRSLFADRIKLLQSLGGLPARASSENLEAEFPGGLPMGTQPGTGGPPFVMPEPAPELTQPRVVSKEVGLEEVVEPTLPRVVSSELVPRAKRPGPSAPTEAQPQLAVSEGAALGPRRPVRAYVPASTQDVPAPKLPVRARPPAEAEAPRDPDHTQPRASAPTRRPNPPLPDEDTDPRVRAAAIEDTAPRARIPVAPAESLDDTDPSRGPRNTTEHERLRARGQERLRTPPQGLPALGDEALLNEPTALRARIASPAPRFTDTAQSMAPVKAPSSGGGLRVVMVLLLLVVVGLAVGVMLKVQRAQVARTREPVAPVVVDEVDAGEALPEVDVPDAALALVADVADAAVEPVAALADAGAPDEVDAGTPDAGVTPSKKPVKKPAKKPVKKKKKR